MNRNFYDEDYSPNNREKVMSPKGGSSWCICDRAKIGNWTKCNICHRRNGRHRLKR